MDAHLVLDGHRAVVVGSPIEPSAFTLNLGTRNSEIPFVPGGASGSRASTRWDDVLGMGGRPR